MANLNLPIEFFEALDRLEQEIANVRRQCWKMQGKPLEMLDLRIRTLHALKTVGFTSIEEVAEVAKRDPNDLRKVRNLGSKMLDEILTKLKAGDYLA